MYATAHGFPIKGSPRKNNDADVQQDGQSPSRRIPRQKLLFWKVRPGTVEGVLPPQANLSWQPSRTQNNARKQGETISASFGAKHGCFAIPRGNFSSWDPFDLLPRQMVSRK
jgi:hypothetical protein